MSPFPDTQFPIYTYMPIRGEYLNRHGRLVVEAIHPPVRDEVACQRQIIDQAVLTSPGFCLENLDFFIVGSDCFKKAMGQIDRGDGIIFPVDDDDGHPDFLGHSFKVEVAGFLHGAVEVRTSHEEGKLPKWGGTL